MKKEADAVKKATYKSQYENALAVELKIKEEMGNRESNIDYYTNIISALNAFYDLYAKYDTYEAALQAKITARNDEDVKAYAGKVLHGKQNGLLIGRTAMYRLNWMLSVLF